VQRYHERADEHIDEEAVASGLGQQQSAEPVNDLVGKHQVLDQQNGAH